MQINPDAKAELRQPRGIVRINGEIMSGWIDWEVENNRFADADTFSATFAMGGLPKGRDDYWFAAQSSLLVEILAGFPPDPNNYDASGMVTWFVGYSDTPEFDYGRQEIHLHGRDLTAKLIDSQTGEQFKNKTASEIVSAIAKSYGLTTTFITPTTAKIGNFTEIDNIGLTNQLSDWDLVVKLAHISKMVVYISGYDLHFEAPPSDTSTPYLLQWGTAPFTFNGTDLQITRNMTLADNVQVTVTSFHQQSGKVIAKWPKTAAANATPYYRKFPNLKPDQALERAKAIYYEIMKHELTLHAEMPADNLLTITTPIKLTGTAFDQIYFPDVVKRRMSAPDGYMMTATARSISTQNAGA